ncbi:hypothetical protein [Enterococcus caccae]|uniref:Uncharacterized protein n=1 Tax=Enterococcus caccae ATCC BAA-1240 TaxID=1158612 RepID=R3U650_9ENTE|nr:hypothetical protein [Enterococcus caccae]EOL49409.1 hypothetical protein UC7_00787 [Enterococcus caccae ATCC BAA-1240]EOT56461.1 hypothetical protein I580_03262 [Enterococcus caccae ATCC BAA-1240]OJG25235.1 hypothetical protein RU98_GL001060 [Enterococcus caccae]
MDNSTKLGLKTENNQPIKKLSHQDIYELYDMLEQLKSWQEPLNLLGRFFGDMNRPVDKRKIAKEYYSCSQIFNIFNLEFAFSMQRMETQINELRRREKV